MLNLPIKPAKGRAKRHNRYPVTGYFEADELPKLKELAGHHNCTTSELLRGLVNRAHEELLGKKAG
jgi:hypothetical protein